MDSEAPAQQERRINQLLATATGLPTLPGVAMQVITTLNDARSEVDDIVAVIQRDPALVAKLLRVVNSPVYGSRRGVESLQQAVVMLGMKATQSLALSFSLVSALRLQAVGALDYSLYWRRCLLAATAAKQVSARVAPADTEAAFLAALTQDLGMLVLDRVDPALYRKMSCSQRDHSAVEAHEFRRFGRGHALIGEWMACEWGFSSRMQKAIAFSHSPASFTGSEADSRFVCVVALSASIADMMLADDAGNGLPVVTSQAQAWLSLSEEDVGDIMQSMTRVVPVFERVFDTSLLDEEKLQMIASLAREKLAELRAHNAG